MKKIAIIPAYNEKDSIVKTIADLKKNAPDFDYIIINDCSTDETGNVCKINELHVVNLPINLGIGGAVQTGYLYAYNHGYDLAVQFDGDGQHDAKYLDLMSEKMAKEDLDMVIGSRFITNEGFQSSSIRRVGIRYFAKMMKCLFGQEITDATSGMRMCNRKVMQLFVKDYPRDYPEPETVARLLRHKYKVQEMPVIMHEREAGVSSISMTKSAYYMIKVRLAILIERLR